MTSQWHMSTDVYKLKVKWRQKEQITINSSFENRWMFEIILLCYRNAHIQ